ncbi:hypothetical protein [Falsiporphyromonas endometrii]
MISKDFTPYQSIYYYFCKRKNEGIVEEFLNKLRSLDRITCVSNKIPP